jgi:ABC-type hemin transport system ATPase subunit
VAAECRAERAAVVVTHDLNLAAQNATRMLLLDGGRVAMCDSPERVMRSTAIEKAFDISMHTGTLPDGRTPFVVPM